MNKALVRYSLGAHWPTGSLEVVSVSAWSRTQTHFVFDSTQAWGASYPVLSDGTIPAGLAREDSYRLVQKNAMRAWNGEGDLLDLLKADPEVTKSLSITQLEAMFDLGYHLKQGDTIFKRGCG